MAFDIILQRPDDARARPGDYFKDENRYTSIFGDPKIHLQTYLTCVRIVRRVEKFLANRGVEKSDIKNLLFYVAAMATREFIGIKHPPANKLPRADQLKDDLLLSVFRNVSKFYRKLSQDSDADSVARGPLLLKKLNAQWDRKMRNAKKAGG